MNLIVKTIAILILTAWSALTVAQEQNDTNIAVNQEEPSATTPVAIDANSQSLSAITDASSPASTALTIESGTKPAASKSEKKEIIKAEKSGAKDKTESKSEVYIIYAINIVLFGVAIIKGFFSQAKRNAEYENLKSCEKLVSRKYWIAFPIGVICVFVAARVMGLLFLSSPFNWGAFFVLLILGIIGIELIADFSDLVLYDSNNNVYLVAKSVSSATSQGALDNGGALSFKIIYIIFATLKNFFLFMSKQYVIVPADSVTGVTSASKAHHYDEKGNLKSNHWVDVFSSKGNWRFTFLSQAGSDRVFYRMCQLSNLQA